MKTMKNNVLRKGKYLLTAMLLVTLLGACSSDDDGNNVPGSENFTRDMIVGEWFEPAGEGAYGIGCYKEDGTMTSTMIRATKRDWLYTTSDGYWEFSGGRLSVVTTVNHMGILNSDSKGVYQPVKLTKYELQMSSLDMDHISGGYRIVDTYQLNVGESRQVVFNDRDFVPQSYSSVCYHIASVDDEGNIEARHLGTTYILVKSSTDTAVIRIVVSDSENSFNDALQSMDQSIQDITKEYGQVYIEQVQEDEKPVRLYYLPDEKVMSIRFTVDTNGYVEYVEQFFTSNITSDEVREELARKYDYQQTDDTEDGRIDWYITSWHCRKVAVGYWERAHQVFMYFMDENKNLEEYDNLFNQVMNNRISLGTLAYVFDYTLTAEDYAQRSFLLSIPDYPFKYVKVSADRQGYVNDVKLYFDDKITVSDIEYFVKRYYYPTSSPNIYVSTMYTYFLAYLEGDDGYLKYLQYQKIN